MFSLDTNTLIYLFKGKGKVAEHLFSVPPGEVAVSSVSLYEIEVGLLCRCPKSGRAIPKSNTSSRAGVCGSF